MAASARAHAQDTTPLFELHHVIALAAFAAESRRVLTALECVLKNHPRIERALSNCIEARGQWEVLPDALPEVLGDAQRRLGVWLESSGWAETDGKPDQRAGPRPIEGAARSHHICTFARKRPSTQMAMGSTPKALKPQPS